MPPIRAPERRSKRIVVLSNQRVNVISTPKRQNSAYDGLPTKLPIPKSKPSRPRSKRLSREEELTTSYIALKELLPRLETHLVLCSQESLSFEVHDIARQVTKLISSIRDLTDWCTRMEWPPLYLGDNNTHDYQFLSKLYICGSIYEKIDKAIAQIQIPADSTAGMGDESFVSQIMLGLDFEGEGTEDDDETVQDGGLRDLLNLLKEKSGVGKRIRSLLPSCPQLPTRPRCYSLVG